MQKSFGLPYLRGVFVSAFTFAKNAVRYDYPLEEAIRSVLPICDECVVAVGDSDDGTLELVETIADNKIRIIRTTWDESLREGGQVLADETNKAFDAINPSADWAIYIQADECLHEAEYPNIRAAMEKHLKDQEVEGLLFDYLHFYGSYDYVGNSPKWYRREIRIIRNDKSIRSYKDAQGFRKEGRKLQVAPAHAHVHHYGWVKHPKLQKVKNSEYQRYWHNDQWLDKHIPEGEDFDYGEIDSLKRFQGAHPQVFQDRMERMNWTFEHDISVSRLKVKDRFKLLALRLFGFIPGEYKNYKLIRS